MADVRIKVAQDTVDAAAEGSWMAAKGSKMGFQVVMDFFTQMAIEGRVFQIRAGDIATPLIGDVPIADTKAELCADCVSGTTIIPCYASIGVTLLPGTANQIKIQSVGVVSSAGTAFVPLNLKSGGPAATSTARVDAAGAVTVTLELATTTLRHFEWSAEFVQDAGTESPFATQPLVWEPRCPPVLVGPRCFYIQIASATGGPGYFAHFDYIELPTANID